MHGISRNDISREDVETIRQSDLFDEAWYRREYRDVELLGMDPVEHYLWLGARLNRSPSRRFDTVAYLELNDDVAAADLNPLLHYLNWGRMEGREYTPAGEARGTASETVQRAASPDPAVARFDDTEPASCPYFEPGPKTDPFDAWLAYNGDSAFREAAIRERIAEIEGRIAFSVVVPVFNPPGSVLDECIRSVLSQSYEAFELILVDDCSTDPSVLQQLRRWAERDRRIKLHLRSVNGHISLATNDGVAKAGGDFLVFLDNDDLLAPHALAILAAYIDDNPEAELIYTDDAKFKDGETGLIAPKFKPDWSPELLLSFCYVSHIKAIRRTLYDRAGGCRQGFEGSQDHDLLLRVGELAEHVGHVPQVLYHRRVLPGSTAVSGHAKPYSFEAGRRASEEAFRRRGVPCSVEHPDWALERGYGIYVPRMPDTGPRVTILVPSRNNWRSLDRLLRSLEKTAYENYDVMVIDNMSDDPETLAYMRDNRVPHLRVPNPEGGFNFAHINNAAAAQVTSEYVLFLNDDTEVRDARWLSQMVGWGRLPGVGVVGARLLFGDGRVQHGGVVTLLPWHVGRTAFRGLRGKDLGYLMLARVTRNCSAVTAACMLVRRELFRSLGGFDAERFGVAYNDIDFCIRARQSGARIVYCGEAELFHHEGSSRGKRDALPEIAGYARLHGRDDDPYYNPHLGRESNRFEIKPTVVPAVARHRPVRVLALTHNLRVEGAPNSAFELLSGLSRDPGFEISVASPADGPLRAAYAEAGIPVRILDKELSINRNLEDYDGLHARFAEATGLDGFDLVYANTAELFWVIEAAARLGVPSIWNIRESQSWKVYYDRYPREIAARALGSFALPYRVVFVSNHTRRRWAPLEEMRNFDVIHNGVDLARLGRREDAASRAEQRRSLGLPDDAVVALNLGTVCARKGQHDLVEAFARLPKEIQANVHLLIVGARPSEYLDYLKNRIEALPGAARERVRLVEETADTRPFWNAADIFTCTSRLESYPRVILEAMAHDLPIITAPTFGVREQVREGVNALLYTPGDIETLAGHLRDLAHAPDRRRAMARANAAVLDCLTSYDEMIARYAALMRAAAFSSVPGVAATSVRDLTGPHGATRQEQKTLAST